MRTGFVFFPQGKSMVGSALGPLPHHFLERRSVFEFDRFQALNPFTLVERNAADPAPRLYGAALVGRFGVRRGVTGWGRAQAAILHDRGPRGRGSDFAPAVSDHVNVRELD